MKRKMFFLLALFFATSVSADPNGTIVPLTKIVRPQPSDGLHPRSPEVEPVLYLDGHTLYAADNTVGTTIQLKDEIGNVVFSTFIYIEGDIQLPTTLSGTYTIEVISGDITFIGEIEL